MAAPVAESCGCSGGGEVVMPVSTDMGYADQGVVADTGSYASEIVSENNYEVSTGGEVMTDQGYNLQPGETLVPGSLQIGTSEAAAPCCGGGSEVFMEAAPVMAAPVAESCGCSGGGEVIMPVSTDMGYADQGVVADTGSYASEIVSENNYEVSTGGEVMTDQGYNLQPGETLVPGSLQIGTSEAAAPVAEVAAPAPQADPASDSPESSSDATEEAAPAEEEAGEEDAEEAAPPAPTPDTSTDA